MNYSIATQNFDPEVLKRVGRLDLVAKLIAQGARRGIHGSRRRGFSTEFSDYKPYVPPDDLRFLDWRLYARTDKLYVKRFQAETNLEMLILLDATRSMAWRWEDRLSKLEYAANLLGAVAAIHIGQQDQVGLLVHDANELHHLPPRSRRSQLDDVFGVLGRLKPGAASTFPSLVEGVTGLKRHRGLIMICSDLEEDEDEIRPALERLAGRNDQTILIHLLDHAEVELPFDGITHLQDAETGDLLPVNLAELRKQHEATLQAFRDTWSAQCRHWGLRYLALDTGWDYVDAMHELVKLY